MLMGRAATTDGDLVSGEFARQQLEVKTPPCADAAQLRNELLRLRATAAAAARDEGVRLCAAGTPVIAAPGRLQIGDHPRYRTGLGQYRAMLDDFSVCAVHAPHRLCPTVRSPYQLLSISGRGCRFLLR